MKNITKNLLACTLLLVSSSSFAELYLGINAGANVVTVTKNLNYSDTTARLYSNYDGLRAQLLLGYNFHFIEQVNFTTNYDYGADDIYRAAENPPGTEFFLAIEANFDYIPGGASSNISPWFLDINATTKEKLNYVFDLFLLGKYRAGNIIIFAGPGWSKGKFKITSSQTAGSIGTTGSNSAWVTGWSAKIGTEVILSNCFNLVITGQYNTFSNFSTSAIEPLTEESVSTSYKPRAYSLMIGINYRL